MPFKPSPPATLASAFPTADAPRTGTLDGLDIRYQAGGTAFEAAHGDEIAAHWAERRQDNPTLFNGKVLVFGDVAMGEHRLAAKAFEISYAGFLAFLDLHGPESGLVNLFGDCMVIGSDGGLLLGRMGRHNNEPGVVKCAGGTPDHDDIDADGRVDIIASAARELGEEMGLAAEEAVIGTDLWAYWGHPYLAIGVPFRFPEPVAHLQARARTHIANEKTPELSDALTVTQDDLSALADSPAHTRALVRHFLGLDTS